MIKEYIIQKELNYYVIIAPFNKDVIHYKKKNNL